MSSKKTKKKKTLAAIQAMDHGYEKNLNTKSSLLVDECVLGVLSPMWP